MYKSMLFLHWKQIRVGLVAMVVGAFALPLMSVSGLGTRPGMDSVSLEAYRFVSGVQAWLALFPLSAAAIGIILALTAWNWDHRYGHVYALSLPMTRWEYTLHKLLAGLTLAAVPALGLWFGAHLAVAFVDLPTGLHAYPNQLAVRFFFAIMLSYGLLFALAAGTMRTTGVVVGVVFGFFFFGTIANDFLAIHVDFFARVDVVQSAFYWLVQSPGPFEVFTGNWSLIDV